MDTGGSPRADNNRDSVWFTGLSPVELYKLPESSYTHSLKLPGFFINHWNLSRDFLVSSLCFFKFAQLVPLYGLDSSNTSSPVITPRSSLVPAHHAGMAAVAGMRRSSVGRSAVAGGVGSGVIITSAGEGYWVVNRSLRALAVGGNRMGNEGAAALAAAIEPRMNSDGTWVTPLLHAIDASDNVIGTEGLQALARAIEPKCVRCRRSFSPPNSSRDLTGLSGLCLLGGGGSRAGSLSNTLASSPRGGCGPCGPGSSPRGFVPPGNGNGSPMSAGGSAHGGSLLGSVLTSNAAAAAAAAHAAAKLIDGFGISGEGKQPEQPEHPEHPEQPSSEWECDGGFSGPGSACTFDFHSAMRRLDLMHNQPDDELRQRFQRLKSLDGSMCAVNI
jgi:hypothetical protein